MRAHASARAEDSARGAAGDPGRKAREHANLEPYGGGNGDQGGEVREKVSSGKCSKCTGASGREVNDRTPSAPSTCGGGVPSPIPPLACLFSFFLSAVPRVRASPIYLEMSAGYYYLLGAQCSCVVCDTLRASPICLSGRRVLYLFSCAHGNPLSLSQCTVVSLCSLFSYTNRV